LFLLDLGSAMNINMGLKDSIFEVVYCCFSEKGPEWSSYPEWSRIQQLYSVFFHNGSDTCCVTAGFLFVLYWHCFMSDLKLWKARLDFLHVAPEHLIWMMGMHMKAIRANSNEQKNSAQQNVMITLTHRLILLKGFKR
jgi:hypothetical protein